MKKMMLFLGALLFFFSACNDDDDYYVTATFRVTPDEVNFTAEKDSTLLTVLINTLYTNNLYRWVTDSDQSWCTCYPTWGIGSGLIKIVATENTGAERTAIITIHPIYTSIYMEVPVTQAGNPTL